MPTRIIVSLYGFLRALFCCRHNLKVGDSVPEEVAARQNPMITRLRVIVDDPSDVTFATPKPPTNKTLEGQYLSVRWGIIGQSNSMLPAVSRNLAVQRETTTRAHAARDFASVYASPSPIIEPLGSGLSRLDDSDQEELSNNQSRQVLTQAQGSEMDPEGTRRRHSTVYFDAPSYFPVTALGDHGVGSNLSMPADTLDDADQAD